MVIKSVTTVVTVAATTFKKMREELQTVDTMKGKVERVKENMARLQAKLQTPHFDLDRQEQYSRKDSVIIYGIPEPANDDTRENTNDLVVKLAKDIGVNITTADLSASHQLGQQGREGGRGRSLPRLYGDSVKPTLCATRSDCDTVKTMRTCTSMMI